MTQSGISLIAVLIASILGFGLAALWYSPRLFGNQWMAALDISAENIQAEFSPAPPPASLTRRRSGRGSSLQLPVPLVFTFTSTSNDASAAQIGRCL